MVVGMEHAQKLSSGLKIEYLENKAFHEKKQDIKRYRSCPINKLMNSGGDGACAEASKPDKMLISYKQSNLRKNTKT